MATFRVVVVVGLLTMLSGCSSTPRPAEAQVHVLQSGNGDGSGMASEVSGTLSVDKDGCAGIDDAATVWPTDTSWSDANDALRLPTGLLITCVVGVTRAGG